MPIRDALQVLATEGLVDLVSGATAVVTPMSVAELQELYEMREALEPAATRLAVPNMGRAEVIQLRRCFEAMTETKVPTEFLAANAAFHRIICAQANRPRMAETVEQLRKLTDRYLYLHLEVFEKRDLLLKEHAQIVDAVEAGDGAQAASLTCHHLETAHNFILQYMLEHPVLDRRAPIGALQATSGSTA